MFPTNCDRFQSGALARVGTAFPSSEKVLIPACASSRVAPMRYSMPPEKRSASSS
ncbi:MAG: hypothetical protein H6574_17385 [Lewinellaceae bacterium]|nr:hypothetical protein [Lewinellaceae bacterium]